MPSRTNRKSFIKTLALLSGIPFTMGLNKLYSKTLSWQSTERMPIMFFGHGSPMNIIRDNNFTQSLAELGSKTIRPKAILMISAHWLTMNKTAVSVNPNPKTIYDFGGFPEALYKEKYEPKGHPELAKDLAQNVSSIKIHEDHEMGLDHGAWSILKHMYPEQDIPVFQMSIDYAKPASYHYELAKELKQLRNKGVLIMASGNIVHNLRILDFANEDADVLDWALDFDQKVKQRIDNKSHVELINYEKLGASAKLAVPTNDHYLPMIYSLGLLDKDEQTEYTFEGFQHASISMRCFQSLKV